MTDKELFSAAMTARFGERPKVRRIMHTDFTTSNLEPHTLKIQEMSTSKATIWFDENDVLYGIMVWPKF